MKKGIFVISLDFELYWGIGDHIDYSAYMSYFDCTIKSIPKILALFQHYEIHCTWATVGMLWNEDWQTWHNSKPNILPSYRNEQLNNYYLAEQIDKTTAKDEHFFALQIIRKIASIPNQEIGSHTYSHYYCYEENTAAEAFIMDLQKAKDLALQHNHTLRSLVLPRNQFVENSEHMLHECGFTSVRVNPNVWYWQLENLNKLSSKFTRIVDAYFPFLKKKSYPWEAMKLVNGVLKQPASRFLRNASKFTLINKFRINRIKSEMTHAAKNNHVYHLWWHPHNFAVNTEYAIQDLEEILKHYHYLNKEFQMESLNMKEVSESYHANG